MEQLTTQQKVFLFIFAGIAIIVIFIYVFTKDNNIDYSNLENLYEQNTVLQEDVKNAIVVHVIGEVVNSGVVELEVGARIIDAIEKCGGVTDEADLTKINLAYKVEDGQRICIPSINDEEFNEEEYITKGSGQTGIIENNTEEGSAININIASQTELEQLSGIGPSTALKIIQYRDENGRFDDIEDIKNVPGIGDAKFESIKESICVN